MRLHDFLTERISSQVFHYTRVTTALKILQSGEFELSHTLGTSWEAQFAPKGYPYFLSTTRTRHGGYHGYLGQDAVLFELDGDFYNQRYPGRAVDYWNNRDPAKDHHKAHEAEDRIFSREAAIPAAITAIDLYIAPDADEPARARTRQVIILAKKSGIPVNLFNDQEAWRMRDTRKTADVSQLTGQDPARGYVSSRRGGFLKPWMELIQAKQKSQLSKDADRKRYDLQYTYDRQGLAKSLAVDLSNARKPGPDPDRNNAVRIIKFMQQNGLSTVEDLVNYLADKWKNIKESHQPVNEAIMLAPLLSPVISVLQPILGNVVVRGLWTALQWYGTYEGISQLYSMVDDYNNKLQVQADMKSMGLGAVGADSSDFEWGMFVLWAAITWLGVKGIKVDLKTILDKIPNSILGKIGSSVKDSIAKHAVTIGGAGAIAGAADKAISAQKEKETVAATPDLKPRDLPQTATSTTSKSDQNEPPITKTSKPIPTTVQALAAANNISNPNLIRLGQNIKLPDGSTYTVVKGDNLWDISKGKFRGQR